MRSGVGSVDLRLRRCRAAAVTVATPTRSSRDTASSSATCVVLELVGRVRPDGRSRSYGVPTEMMQSSGGDTARGCRTVVRASLRLRFQWEARVSARVGPLPGWGSLLPGGDRIAWRYGSELAMKRELEGPSASAATSARSVRGIEQNGQMRSFAEEHRLGCPVARVHAVVVQRGRFVASASDRTQRTAEAGSPAQRSAAVGAACGNTGGSRWSFGPRSGGFGGNIGFARSWRAGPGVRQSRVTCRRVARVPTGRMGHSPSAAVVAELRLQTSRHVTGTPRDDGRRARCGRRGPYGANGLSVLGVSSSVRRASAPRVLARATGGFGSRASVHGSRARREGRRRGTPRTGRLRSAGFGSSIEVARFGIPPSGRWSHPGFGSGGDVGGDEGAPTRTVVSRVSGGDIASASVL